jgi:hypothetical protein
MLTDFYVLTFQVRANHAMPLQEGCYCTENRTMRILSSKQL